MVVAAGKENLQVKDKDMVQRDVKFLWAMVLLVAAVVFFSPVLAEARDKLPAELRQHGAIVLIIDPVSGAIVDANQAATDFYGYSLDTLQAMSIQDINVLPPDEVVAEFTRVKEQERDYFIFPHRLANGEIRTVEVYSSPFVSPLGRKLLLSIIHDSTGKVLIEEELLHYKDSLEHLVELRTDEAVRERHRAFWTALVGVTAVAAAILLVVFTVVIHRSRRQWILHSQRQNLLLELDNLIDAPQREMLDFALQASLTSTQSDYAFVGLLDESESTMTIHSWSKGVLAQCAVQDKSLQLPLNEGGLWGECVRERRILLINNYMAEHPGKKGCPQGHVTIKRLLCVPVFQGKSIVAMVVMANKRHPYVEDDGLALTVLLQKVWGRLQRNRDHAALSEAKREIELLLYSIPTLLIRIGLDRTVLRWNQTAQVLFGLEDEKVLGRPLPDCPLSWQWAEVEAAIARCIQGKQPIQVQNLRFTRVEGTPGFLDLVINAIRDDNVLTGLLIQGREVTSLRLLESQLLQAQKLEAIGQLAAGIAHEINTPAQFVSDNVEFLSKGFVDLDRVLSCNAKILEAARQGRVPDELVRQTEAAIQEADLGFLRQEIPLAIAQIKDGIERISKIVRSMKEFAHPGGREKNLADINKALENTIIVARNEWKYVADMETDLDPALPLVPCLISEINQAFLNIIVNAAHAIRDKIGQDSEHKGILRVSTAKAGDQVEIRISDSGKGIPKAIQAKIFDPFFTTKPVGQGTGQGLNIAYAAIVEKHGGSITFASEEGRGTTFFIRLPAAV